MDNSMTFEVIIDAERRYTLAMAKMLRIREENMDQHLAEQPGQYQWVASLAALAQAKRRRLEIELEVAEASFVRDLRASAAQQEIRITEKAIEAESAINKRLIQLRSEIVAAQEQEDLCWAAEQAFRQRRDCLVTLAANMRAAQKEPELHVNHPDVSSDTT